MTMWSRPEIFVKPVFGENGVVRKIYLIVTHQIGRQHQRQVEDARAFRSHVHNLGRRQRVVEDMEVVDKPVVAAVPSRADCKRLNPCYGRARTT